MQRIQIRNLGGRKGVVATCHVICRAAETSDGAPCASGRVRTSVLNDAIAHSQRRYRNGLAIRFCAASSLVVHKGAGVRVAVVFVRGAMNDVSAALGDHGDLCAGSAALVGVVVTGGYTKFLHGVERDGQDGRECVPAGVIDTNTVDRDVALVAARR